MCHYTISAILKIVVGLYRPAHIVEDELIRPNMQAIVFALVESDPPSSKAVSCSVGATDKNAVIESCCKYPFKETPSRTNVSFCMRSAVML